MITHFHVQCAQMMMNNISTRGDHSLIIALPFLLLLLILDSRVFKKLLTECLPQTA